MGVDPGRLPEDSVRQSESGRHRSAGAGRAETAGFDSSGFERNGVDRIPESDRTSTPWTFFVIFIGGSVGLGAVSFGWVGMTFGLGLWATISAIAVGTAVGVLLLVPLVLLGSRTATNNATASGAAFGVRGRLIGSGIGLLTCLVSVALTVGLPDSAGIQAVVFALVAAVSAAVAIWGYRWLVRCTAAIFAIGGLLMILMPVAFTGRIQWSYPGSEPLLGTFGATWLLVATTVGVGGALVVCTIVGDWTRYIRSDVHPPRKLAPVAALALFLGFAVPAAIGAIVSTAFADPFAPFPVSLAGESPLWYAVPLLPFAVLGGVGLVAQSLYSAGLDLEALVVSITRARATVIIAVVGVVLVYLGLLAPTIQGAIGAALLVLAELSAPWAVIVGIDLLATGGRYDPDDLQVFNRRETGGRYWYTGGWHRGAVIAWAAGSVIGLLTIQTLIFSGPLSGIALGVDVSLLLGALVAAVIYLPLRGRRTQPA
jgi:purine-cytosine permease-like protein